MRRQRYIAITLVVLLVATVLVGCRTRSTGEGAKEPAQEVRRGGTVVIGYMEEPNTLDPHKTAAGAAYFVMSLISDPIVETDPQTGDFIPHLAKRWEVSGDGLEVTLYLRDDVKFHSGVPFTARALKATWDRAFDPKTKTVAASKMLGPVKEIIALDDYTLKLRMEKPFGPLFYGLSLGGYTHAIDPTNLEKYGEDYGRHPASTGPYKFEEWVTGQWITLVRNEDYKWGPSYVSNQGPPYPEKIQIKYILEDATRVAALEAGEVHIAPVPPMEVDRFKNNPNFSVFSYLASGVSMSLWFNQNKPPLDDVRVRQALCYAIDKQAIIEGAAAGHARPAHGPLPPTIWGYWKGVEEISYKFDPEKSKALLEEAGWKLAPGDTVRKKDGKPLKLSLFIMPADAWRRTAELLQAQFRDVGVQVEIQSYEWGTLMQYLSEGRHDMNLMGYGYGDPDILYLALHSSQAGSGTNWCFVRDPDIDAAVAGQRNTVLPEERLRYAAEAQRLVVERAVWAPIYISENYVAVNKKVQGFKLNFRGTWLLHDIWLKED